MKWGMPIGGRLPSNFNAKAETLDCKPTFQRLLATRWYNQRAECSAFASCETAVAASVQRKKREDQWQSVFLSCHHVWKQSLTTALWVGIRIISTTTISTIFRYRSLKHTHDRNKLLMLTWPVLRDTLSRRCVFLFNGFYEWKNNTPFFVQRNGSEIMMLAGLYDVTKHPENGTAYMCTVVTVNASECVKCLHHRMPGVYWWLLVMLCGNVTSARQRIRCVLQTDLVVVWSCDISAQCFM